MGDDIPSWLTNEFLKSALECDKEQSFTVTDFKIERAIPAGNNYICDIFRIEIQYKSLGIKNTDNGHLISLIMKIPKAGITFRMGMIQREIDIYQKLMPILKKVNPEYMFFPNNHRSSQDNVLIMEDLNSLGYQMADRMKQLSYEESIVVLKILGRFHATTVKCHEEDPSTIEVLGQEIIFNDEAFRQFFKSHFVAAAEHVLKFPKVAKYHDKIIEYSKVFHINMAEMKPQNFNFNVLNHGDCWVTNLLIKYDNGKPIDVKLIDHQMTRYNTPAFDLIFFLYGSVQDDVRKAHIEDLLSVYHNELVLTLEKYSTRLRLSYDDLKKSLDTCEFFAFMVNFILLPYVLADPDKTVDFSDVADDCSRTNNQEISILFTSEKFIRLFHNRLEEFDQRGFF